MFFRHLFDLLWKVSPQGVYIYFTFDSMTLPASYCLILEKRTADHHVRTERQQTGKTLIKFEKMI